MVDSMMTRRELRDARNSSGLSRSEFAARLSVDEATYRRMERGSEPIPARFDDEVDRILSAQDGGENE